MISKDQKRQLKNLRSGKPGSYEGASLYTVLLDLCEGNYVSEVAKMLHNVAHDMGNREEIESTFDELKNWDWIDESNENNT